MTATSMVGRRLRSAAAVALAVAIFALGAALTEGFAGHLWANLWWTAASAVAAVACFITARRVTVPHRRAAWWWFGAGAASWFGGMLIWSTEELVFGNVTPFPSVADILFDGIAPCAMIACARYGAGQRSVALTFKQLGDLAVIGCVLVLAATLALYGPVVASADDAVYVLAALAYPVLHGSALIFGLFCWWHHVAGGHRWVLGLQLAGLALLAAVTTLYAESLLGRRYEAGAWIDAVWIACFALMTWAAREELAVEHAAPTDETRRSDVPLTDALVPAGAALVAVVASLAFRDRWDGPVIVVGGVAGIGLAVAMAVRLVASQQLERDLRERLSADEERARRLQAQLLHAQRLHSIGALASGVAHDQKNLVQIMITGLSLARRKLDKGVPATGELEEVERAMWRAADLSTRLLDLARKRPGRRTVVDPGQLVASVARLLGRALPSGIELDVDEPAGQAPRIEVDAGALEHALLNLGLNARDAMKGRDGGRLRIAVEHRKISGIAGPAVVLTVDDDGPGIPADVLPLIFEPFFTTKAPGEGTGLGLATVEAQAAEHRGGVRASNRPGGGARFELAFPALDPRVAAIMAARNALPPRSTAAPVQRNETILVVDGSEASRLAVTGALERSGFVAIGVDTAEAALATAARSLDKIGAVVADAATGLVGKDALNALRATGCRAPIVLLTSADAPPSGDYARVVHKPLDRSGLIDAVHAAMHPAA